MESEWRAEIERWEEHIDTLEAPDSHAPSCALEAAKIALSAARWRDYIHNANPDDDPGSLYVIDASLEGRGPIDYFKS